MEHLTYIADVAASEYTDLALVTECVVMSAQTNDWN